MNVVTCDNCALFRRLVIAESLNFSEKDGRLAIEVIFSTPQNESASAREVDEVLEEAVRKALEDGDLSGLEVDAGADVKVVSADRGTYVVTCTL